MVMTKPRVFAGTAVLVVVSAVACNRTQTNREAERAAEEVQAAAETAGDKLETAGEKLADAWLTAKIQAQFFADDDVKSRYINVTTRDGVVKLKGFVASDDARRQVLEITRNTDGVRQIDDRELLVGRPANESFDIVARPPSLPPVATTGVAPVAPLPAPDDSTVVSLVQARYYLDPALKTRQNDVTAANGVVTLKGQVASEGERAQALSLARSTQGVQRVEDALTVAAGIQ
jgi:hyperosmotically inducible protein